VEIDDALRQRMEDEMQRLREDNAQWLQQWATRRGHGDTPVLEAYLELRRLAAAQERQSDEDRLAPPDLTDL